MDGITELGKALGEAAARSGDLSPAWSDAGALVLAGATPAAPRRTGSLAGSVRVSTTPGSLQLISPLPYAVPVHWGRRKGRRGGSQPARPWLATQLRDDRAKVTAKVLDHITRPLSAL